MDNIQLVRQQAYQAERAACALPEWCRHLGDRIQGFSHHRGRMVVKAGVDLLLMGGAAGWAWLIAFSFLSPRPQVGPFIAAVAGVQFLSYLIFGLYRLPWRQVSSQDVLSLAGSAALAAPVLAALFLLRPGWFGVAHLPRFAVVLTMEPVLYLALLGGVRMAARTVASSQRGGKGARRVLVVGTGDAARSLVWQIQNSTTEYRVVGLVDDDPQRHGTRMLGVPVLGACEEVAALAARLRVDQIVIAIPSLRPERLREILALCEGAHVPVRLLPPLRELMHHRGVAALREVHPEDLLPRPEVKLDEEAVARYVHDATVLVTGGGGSIGSELCRQILRIGAARLLVLGRGENSVFEVVQELHALGAACEVTPVICDVQDRRALRRVFERFHPTVVFHAAAHKHVPLMERYPAEAVKNNILGTLNVVRLAAEHGVQRFVLVSTDKAVNPTSVMGTTKRVAEKIVKAFAETKGLNMVSVRFGNVLGSRGSVVPVMTRQIRNGQPVTVTDPDMVRYFMTIPEATQLILQAGAIGGCGEVFVLDMGHPVRILDLAQDLIRLCGLVPNQDVPIKIIGRRPGEKLKEDILHQMEVEGARKHGHFYIAPTEAVDLEELLNRVQNLRVAVETGRHDRVVTLLRGLVPTFLPDRVHALEGARPEPAAVRKAS